ncbi:ABC transporter substrate-binding protein [Acetobacter sp. AN02]|uniref:MlaC/ttg2D family ABC transporter substrate-binding protein n=1 Tax=Acetobacter sp. AN02 TaxID=2894186 RepID=UPI0024341EB7|nr:ABC transporter substrate-binding protein [Acetobacter sp. AN02]MDG6094022.1 ABC transporter substrate-binding protein [Acetobacter sp. AN02]
MTIRLHRRNILGLVAACVFSLAASSTAFAAGTSADFVRTLAGRLVSIINSNASPGQAKSEVNPLLQQAIDFDNIAKFCLGRYWNVATPDQRTEYLGLFHQALTNAIMDKLGSYRGVRVKVTGTETLQQGAEGVSFILSRPQQPDAQMQLIVRKDGDSYKVVDLIGEGVSLRLTQSKDYNSFIARNGGKVENLIRAMKNQVAHHDDPAN